MKTKLILAFALALGLNSVNAQTFFEEGPADDFRRNSIAISPFHFADQTLFMTYEYLYRNEMSTALSVGFTLAESDVRTKNGVQLEAQQRFYLYTTYNGGRGDQFGGFYAGPYVRYRNLVMEERRSGELEETFNGAHVAGGAILGYRFSRFDRLYFDFFLGGGIQKAFGDTDAMDDPLTAGYTGITGKAGFTIGVSF